MQKNMEQTTNPATAGFVVYYNTNLFV